MSARTGTAPSTPAHWAPDVRVLRVGPASWRFATRPVLVAVVAAVVLFALMTLDVALGEVPVPIGTAAAVLVGGGDEGSQFIIRELRLPQMVVAALVGLALGLAGALTQTFARNPLASPDLLGVTEGASVGAVALLVSGGGAGGTALATTTGLLATLGVPLAAFLGGSAAAALLYVLAWRGGLDARRLVLVGIGVSAMLTAVVQWLITTARLQDAGAAQVWLNGSLTSRGWDQARPLLAALLLLTPVAVGLVRHLSAVQLGEDVARALGVRLQAISALVLVVAVGLSATAVAACGPLPFVALVVPQVGLRLTGGSRPPLLVAALLGGALVVGADLVTRVVLPFAVPAGVVTAILGAPYLIWLLVRLNRKATA